jgi:hypothetical protein
MFGGSREAVSRMLADRNYRDTVGTTTGNMLLQGWNTAAGLASQNTDREQQTNLTNASLENTINALNAQLGTQVSLGNAQLGTQNSQFNAGQANQMDIVGAQLANQAGIAGAQLGTQTNLANASAQNALNSQYQNLSYQGAQSDAARFLQAIGLQSQNDLQGFQGALSGINSLMGIGTQQQQTAQAGLDAYWKQLNNLAALLRIGNPGGTVTGNSNEYSNTSGTTNSTTNTQGQTTTSKPIDWASILLGAGKLLG